MDFCEQVFLFSLDIHLEMTLPGKAASEYLVCSKCSEVFLKRWYHLIHILPSLIDQFMLFLVILVGILGHLIFILIYMSIMINNPSNFHLCNGHLYILYFKVSVFFSFIFQMQEIRVHSLQETFVRYIFYDYFLLDIFFYIFFKDFSSQQF